MSYRFHTGTSGVAGDFIIGGDAADVRNIFDGGGTIMIWAYADSYGMLTFGRMMEKDGISPIHGWKLFVDNFSGSPNRFGFVQQFSGAEGDWTTPNDSFPLDTWLHLAVTYDSDSTANNPIFYVNGVLVATTELNTPTGTRDDDTGAPFLIGQNLAYTRAFDGRLADPRAYGQILSAARIRTIYTARGRDRDITGRLRRYPMSPHREAIGVNTPWIDDTENSVTTGTTIVATVPAHVDGDLLILVVNDGSDGGTPANITTPGGWTQRVHLDFPSTATTPVLAVYTRAASSEPATYTVTSNLSSPKVALMTSFRGVTTTPQDVATNTGTTANPISPSVTPGSNALVFRVAGMDSDTQEPFVRADYFALNIRGRRILSSSGGGSNGIVTGTGEESLDGGASGTRTWFSGSGSDQWGAATLSFLGGDGIEGFPAHDLSPAQIAGDTWHKVIGAEDTLRAGGW